MNVGHPNVFDRALNTVSLNGGADITLNTGTGIFTIAAGTYDIEISVPAFKAGFYMSILTSVSLAGDIAYGTHEYIDPTISMQTRSTILTRQTFGSSQTYRIQQYIPASNPIPGTDVLGVAEGPSPYPRTFTVVKILRVA